MFVIAGLGNPGRQFERTRHNMGFMVVDRLAEKNGIKIDKIKHRALIGSGMVSGQKALLVKPQTYMNLSGESLLEIVCYYDIEPEELLVIYDDMDLEAGSLRIRKKGSAGSHNGMKSVIDQLDTEDMPRMRIGIGQSNGMEWKDFVTGKIPECEEETMESVIDRASDAVMCILDEGIDKAMNKYNVKQKTLEGEDV